MMPKRFSSQSQNRTFRITMTVRVDLLLIAFSYTSSPARSDIQSYGSTVNA